MKPFLVMLAFTLLPLTGCHSSNECVREFNNKEAACGTYAEDSKCGQAQKRYQQCLDEAFLKTHPLVQPI